ncbi:MAG: GNAT family N-acetyltransferase [Pseudomonadota bacterium]
MDCRHEVTIREARSGDADAIARVFSASRRLLTFLPDLHTVEEDRRFIAGTILRDCAVTVGVADGEIVSFLARQNEEIRLLHTCPEFIGNGAGSRLIDGAKSAPVAALELWCFQANMAARRFYERHGFEPIAFTDGKDNEEQTPDVRYRWERRA